MLITVHVDRKVAD